MSREAGYRANELRMKGKTHVQIANILKKEGYKNQKGKPFALGSMHRIIFKYQDDFLRELFPYETENRRVARNSGTAPGKSLCESVSDILCLNVPDTVKEAALGELFRNY